MSSHPYAFTGLTPSTSSSGKTNTSAHPSSNLVDIVNTKPAPETNTNANSHALVLATAGTKAPGFGIQLGNTSIDGNAAASASSAGPATQVWRRGLGVLRDIDDENDDDDVPSHTNRSPSRTNGSPGRSIPHHHHHHHTVNAADVSTDDDEESKRMAEERRKSKWQREADARRAQRRSGSGLGQ
jgi:hypothetical protein